LGTLDFTAALAGEKEVRITTRGRRTGKAITVTVWFVESGGTVYLLPVNGSDTSWYKNVLKEPSITLSARGKRVEAMAKPVREQSLVRENIERFNAKYGAGEITRWYTKLDASVEVPLPG